jgi:hypothetical protein
MIANSAFLAAMALVLLVFWLLGALAFLAPYKRVVVGQHLWLIVGVGLVLFGNLFTVSYLLTRSLFLKGTGRKLAHVDRQLGTTDTIVRDLSERLAGRE